MSGSSGNCSFIKQERMETENYDRETRSNGDGDTARQKEDQRDDVSNDKNCKRRASSPTYPKLTSKNSGQLLHQQPDSQSSINNNSIKSGKL